MKRAVILLAVLATAVAGPAVSQIRTLGPPQPLACVSPQETRALFVTRRLMPPFRVMQATASAAQAEAVAIQLCRFNEILVYDVTLVGREGRVWHKLVDALTGVALGGPHKPRDPQ